MKKIYAFLAAALMSVSLFAAPATVPTSADLTGAGYNPASNVVLALYFDTVPCNRVVLAGNYAEKDNWTLDPAKGALVFKALDGFDGWYAVEFPWKEGVMAKPVQLKKDGDQEIYTAWDYQCGDPKAWAMMDGSLAAEISAEGDKSEAYPDGRESKVVYPSVGTYIYEIKYWREKKNPCVYIPKYKYTIYLIDPECDDFAPALVGDINGWSNSPMAESSINIPGHDLNGEFAWVLVFSDEADHCIKFREVGDTDWSNQLQYKKDGGWVNFENYPLPAVVNSMDTAIVFNYKDNNNYRYAQCGAQVFDITLNAKLPANAPEIVELMGNFKGGVWNGTGVIMTKNDDGSYTAHIQGDGDNQFKFRSGVGSDEEKWENQIWKYDDQTQEWKVCSNFIFANEDWEVDEDELTAICEVDLVKYGDHCWATDVPGPGTGIENVVLTEKARKVVVDGQIYIIRDNKLFNIHGAQLR